MALENVKALFTQLNFSVKPEGCTPDQVQALQQQMGITFPPSYREFLLWMGVKPAGILLGSNWLPDDLPTLKAKTLQLMKSNSFPKPLPDDAFVFWMNQMNVCTFLLLSKGDDSPVYRYHQSLDMSDFSIINKNYPEWLSQQIQDHVTRMKSFGQKW